MAGNLRALRRRIRSTRSTKKIFSAQELIAGARIVRAQNRVEASKPYAREITRVLSALASSASLDHPLLTERENPRRAAVLVITSDRGFAGSYNVNVLRRTEELLALLRQEGKEPVLYVVGRKGETYYRFRDREMEQTFTGFSEQPAYSDAQEVGRVLIDVFTAGEDDDEQGGAGADGLLEIYVGAARTTTSWELATDVVARTPDAPEVTRAVRLYGIVEGALMYAVDRAVGDAPLTPTMSARLERLR